MSSSANPPVVPGGSGAPVHVNVHTYPAQLQYPPRTYLVFSVLVTIICFWPVGLLGIVAVVNASRVNSLWRAKQHDKARKASRAARNWGLLTLGIWVVVVVAVVIWASINYVNR